MEFFKSDARARYFCGLPLPELSRLAPGDTGSSREHQRRSWEGQLANTRIKFRTWTLIQRVGGLDRPIISQRAAGTAKVNTLPQRMP